VSTRPCPWGDPHDVDEDGFCRTDSTTGEFIVVEDYGDRIDEAEAEGYMTPEETAEWLLERGL
jgi:hypothetical protein